MPHLHILRRRFHCGGSRPWGCCCFRTVHAHLLEGTEGKKLRAREAVLRRGGRRGGGRGGVLLLSSGFDAGFGDDLDLTAGGRERGGVAVVDPGESRICTE